MRNEPTTRELLATITGFRDEMLSFRDEMAGFRRAQEATNSDLLDAMLDFRTAVEHQFRRVDKRFDVLETRVDFRFSQVDRRFDKLEARIEDLETFVHRKS